MAGSAGARFALLAAMVAPPGASAIRDPFDPDSVLDVSSDHGSPLVLPRSRSETTNATAGAVMSLLQATSGNCDTEKLKQDSICHSEGLTKHPVGAAYAPALCVPLCNDNVVNAVCCEVYPKEGMMHDCYAYTAETEGTSGKSVGGVLAGSPGHWATSCTAETEDTSKKGGPPHPGTGGGKDTKVTAKSPAAQKVTDFITDFQSGDTVVYDSGRMGGWVLARFDKVEQYAGKHMMRITYYMPGDDQTQLAQALVDPTDPSKFRPKGTRQEGAVDCLQPFFNAGDVVSVHVTRSDGTAQAGLVQAGGQQSADFLADILRIHKKQGYYVKFRDYDNKNWIDFTKARSSFKASESAEKAAASTQGYKYQPLQTIVYNRDGNWIKAYVDKVLQPGDKGYYSVNVGTMVQIHFYVPKSLRWGEAQGETEEKVEKAVHKDDTELLLPKAKHPRADDHRFKKDDVVLITWQDSQDLEAAAQRQYGRYAAGNKNAMIVQMIAPDGVHGHYKFVYEKKGAVRGTFEVGDERTYKTAKLDSDRIQGLYEVVRPGSQMTVEKILVAGTDRQYYQGVLVQYMCRDLENLWIVATIDKVSVPGQSGEVCLRYYLPGASEPKKIDHVPVTSKVMKTHTPTYRADPMAPFDCTQPYTPRVFNAWKASLPGRGQTTKVANSPHYGGAGRSGHGAAGGHKLGSSQQVVYAPGKAIECYDNSLGWIIAEILEVSPPAGFGRRVRSVRVGYYNPNGGGQRIEKNVAVTDQARLRLAGTPGSLAPDHRRPFSQEATTQSASPPSVGDTKATPGRPKKKVAIRFPRDAKAERREFDEDAKVGELLAYCEKKMHGQAFKIMGPGNRPLLDDGKTLAQANLFSALVRVLPTTQ